MKNKDLFLLGFYSKVPKDPRRTSTKGFGKNEENWSYNESVHFTHGLKDKDHVRANVILNLSKQKMVKCSFNPNNDFQTLFGYYRDNYPQYVNILESGLRENQVEKIAQETKSEEPKKEETPNE